jgi:tRNA pseudouridine38-40 synthase
VGASELLARMSEQPVTRWKAVCAYDGTAFAGWQSQPDGQGIQDVIEARLGAIFARPVRIHGSGRTDAGVHARGQVFHFDAAWRHPGQRLLAALRVGLPPSLQIKSVTPVPPDFHARFSATGKRYCYYLFMGDAEPFVRPYVWVVQRPRPLDFAAIAGAAAVLKGRHDFSAYAAYNGSEPGDSVRDLRRAEMARRGRSLRFTFEADGFLYKMVRSLVGALIAVGEGKLTAEQIAAMLQGRRRTEVVETAPPQGLFLEKVFY